MKVKYITLRASFVVLLLISCNRSSKSFSQKKDNSLKNYNLESFLPKNKAESLYNTINFFDNYLENNYSEIFLPERRMHEFISDLIRFYDVYDESFNTDQKVLNNATSFCKYIQNLKKTKLFDDIFIDNIEEIQYSKEIDDWVNSILKKEGFENMPNNNNPNEETENNSNFEYEFNCRSVYYYSIYKCSKPSDLIIREYIEQIVASECITFLPQVYLQRIINSVSLKDLNNPLLKAIIFTDFYLPILLNMEDRCL